MDARKESLLSWLLLLLCFALLAAVLSPLMGYSLFTPSPYNTYTHQALAWRQGRAFLEGDIPHLELAIYEGRYYVSFPPVPSVPIFFLSFLFGEQVPDNLLVLVYMAAALSLLFKLLKRRGFAPLAAAAWAFLLCFSSSLLPLSLTGAVWYQAQVLGFLLTIAALERMDAGKPTPALLFYALAVGCRPFNAWYGPLLIFLYLIKRRGNNASYKNILKELLPGLALGLLTALVYAWYNFIRFSNPLEFGHNHLPEFSFQGGTQFSLSHLGRNILDYVLAPPFTLIEGSLAFRRFGFSLFLANPALLLMLAWAATALIKKEFSLRLGMVLLFFALHLFTLLLHRTFGGYQYGARYAVDLLPYAVLALMGRKNKTMHKAEAAVLLLGFALAVSGSLQIHL